MEEEVNKTHDWYQTILSNYEDNLAVSYKASVVLIVAYSILIAIGSMGNTSVLIIVISHKSEYSLLLSQLS